MIGTTSLPLELRSPCNPLQVPVCVVPISTLRAPSIRVRMLAEASRVSDALSLDHRGLVFPTQPQSSTPRRPCRMPWPVRRPRQVEPNTVRDVGPSCTLQTTCGRKGRLVSIAGESLDPTVGSRTRTAPHPRGGVGAVHDVIAPELARSRLVLLENLCVRAESGALVNADARSQIRECTHHLQDEILIRFDAFLGNCTPRAYCVIDEAKI